MQSSLDFALIRWRNVRVFKLLTKLCSNLSVIPLKYKHLNGAIELFTILWNFPVHFLERSARGMTNKRSVWHNNIPVHLV